MKNVFEAKRLMPALLLLMPLLNAYGQIVDENLKYCPREVTVTDTMEAERMAEEKKVQIQQQINALNTIDAELADMISNAGGKAKSQVQQRLLYVVFQHSEITSSPQNTSYGKQLLRSFADGFGVSSSSSSSNPLRLKIEKQIAKGKISKEFVPYIEAYKANIPLASSAISEELSKGWEDLLNQDSLPKKTITIDAPNPYYRPFAYDHRALLDTLDEKAQTVGWEWMDREVSETCEEKYPQDITYKKYASHPEYRLVGLSVYDSSGKLVRFTKFWRSMCNDNYMKEMKRLVYANDYQNNKYNIASASSDVHYALKNRLGLSSESGKKFEKAAKKLDDANINAIKSLDVSSQLKAQVQVRNEVANERARLDNKQALSYIAQLEADHANDFTYLYKISRIDDKSFLFCFLDNSGKATYTFRVTFSNDGNYKIKPNITLVSTSPFSLDIDAINKERSMAL